jgi:hypothetical protein
MIHKLFDIPIWHDYVDPNTYNKTQLLTSIENNYKINPKRNKWDAPSNMHHGYDDWDDPQYEKLNYNMLKIVYQNKINNFVNEVFDNIGDYNCNLQIVNYTAVDSFGHMTKHNHLGKKCSFVGVHYLKFDPTQHSSIRFWNPHTMFINLIGVHPEFSNLGFGNHTVIPPIEEDMILIYPSFLEHDIPQQKETDSLRVSIAFNFNFYKDESDD